MPQFVDFEGVRREFPDDFTPDEIQAALESTQQAPAPPLAAAGLRYDQPGYASALEREPGGPKPLGNKPFGPGIPVTPRFAQIMGESAGRGAADILGAPSDIGTMLANIPLSFADLFIDAPYRFPPSPLGSQALQTYGGDVERAVGVAPVQESEMSDPEKLGANIMRLGAQGLLAGTALARLAASRIAGALPAATTTPRMGDALLRPYINDPARAIAMDTAAGAGGGTVLTASEKFVPRDSPIAPAADAAAVLGGGLAAVAPMALAHAPGAALRAIQGHTAHPDIQAPIQQRPGDPYALAPVSRAVVDRASKLVQRGTSRPPGAVAADIGERVAEARRHGEPIPTTGTISDDPGMMLLENTARVKDPAPFIVRDEQLRSAATERVTSLRDPAAEPRAAQRFVEEGVAAERGAARTKTGAARAEFDAEQERTAARLTEAEAARERTLLQADENVAATGQKLSAAEQTEQALAAQIGARRGTGDAASEGVAEAVAGAKQADEAKKAGMYREAEELGRKTPVATDDLVATAQAIRDEIGPLAQQDARLNNILDDLDRLAPAEIVETGVLDATGKMIAKPAAPKEITARDLIVMRPRLSAARDAAVKLKRGDVVQRLDTINSRIAEKLDAMADAGDAAALKWREADTAFKTEFAPKYREGVGRQLDEAERAGRPVPPTAVAGKFLRPYGGGKEAAADLDRILKNAETEAAGRAAARDYVLADLASVVRSDRINPNALRVWIANRAGMLSQMPGLKAEADRMLQDVVNKREATTALQRDLEKATAERRGAAVKTRKDIETIRADARRAEQEKLAEVHRLEREEALLERDIQRRSTALLLDADPVVAARRVFEPGNPDPEKTMKDIVATLKGDPEALAGWKRAVTDHLIDRVTKAGRSLVEGAEGPVSIAKIGDFVKRHERTLSALYSPEEMHALRRAHRILEPLEKRAMRATIGSPTAENVQAMNMLEAAILARTGSAITTGMIMRRIRVVMRLLPNSDQEVANLINRVALDPEVAQLVLTNNVREVRSPRWNSRLTAVLAAGAAARTDAEQNK